MKCPQAIVKFITLKGPSQLKVGTCHLPLQGLSQWPQQPLTLNTPEEIQGGDQE